MSPFTSHREATFSSATRLSGELTVVLTWLRLGNEARSRPSMTTTTTTTTTRCKRTQACVRGTRDAFARVHAGSLLLGCTRGVREVGSSKDSVAIAFVPFRNHPFHVYFWRGGCSRRILFLRRARAKLGYQSMRMLHASTRPRPKWNREIAPMKKLQGNREKRHSYVSISTE